MIENIPLYNAGLLQEYDYNEQMYEQDTFYYPKNYKGKNNVRPGLVLRTADAYADCLNADKYNSMTGLNTVIYGNF